MATTVLAHLTWIQRWIATATGFFLFSLGGMILTWIVFPMIRRVVRDRLRQRTFVRRLINRLFGALIGLMRITGNLTYSVEGAERLGRRGQMVIANHPSLLDVVFLIAHIPDANCIVKASLWKSPVTRGPVESAGYISNDSGLDMLDDAVEALRDGQTLIVFPEGTRTEPGCAPVLHRGAAAIALRSAEVITPIYIDVHPNGLTKHHPWYRIPRQRMHFKLRVGDDINPRTYLDSAPMPRAARELNEHLHQYFFKEMGLHEANRT